MKMGFLLKNNARKRMGEKRSAQGGGKGRSAQKRERKRSAQKGREKGVQKKASKIREF